MTSYPALRELAEKATSGPWQVVEDEHPWSFPEREMLGQTLPASNGTHVQRRIFTTWDHPQAHSPDMVVNIAGGYGQAEGRTHWFVSIEKPNADFIAAANPTAILDILDKHDAALAEIDRLREALTEIDNWSRAYPLKAFPEPDFAKVRKLLEAGGITLDAVSASNMRHVLEGVGKIASQALRSTP